MAHKDLGVMVKSRERMPLKITQSGKNRSSLLLLILNFPDHQESDLLRGRLMTMMAMRARLAITPIPPRLGRRGEPILTSTSSRNHNTNQEQQQLSNQRGIIYCRGRHLVRMMADIFWSSLHTSLGRPTNPPLRLPGGRIHSNSAL